MCNMKMCAKLKCIISIFITKNSMWRNIITCDGRRRMIVKPTRRRRRMTKVHDNGIFSICEKRLYKEDMHYFGTSFVWFKWGRVRERNSVQSPDTERGRERNRNREIFRSTPISVKLLDTFFFAFSSFPAFSKG